MRPEDLLARLEAGYAYDPMYGQLCNERDQLEAENAKLREEFTKMDQWHSNELMAAMDENAKLRELVVALYHIHFGTEEESWDAWEDFCPCDICEERHGGEAPCAYTAKDLADECCEPITKEIVIDRMRELGVEVG